MLPVERKVISDSAPGATGVGKEAVDRRCYMCGGTKVRATNGKVFEGMVRDGLGCFIEVGPGSRPASWKMFVVG